MIANPKPMPTEALAERKLLARLLAFSQSPACPETLVQHFPSIGHVMAAEPDQLH